MKITNTFRTDITDNDRINTYLEVLNILSPNEQPEEKKSGITNNSKKICI